MEECCAAELRSIDFYLINSEEELPKVVARLEKLEKDKIEGKKDYNNRTEQEKIDQSFKKYETAWSVCKGNRC